MNDFVSGSTGSESDESTEGSMEESSDSSSKDITQQQPKEYAEFLNARKYSTDEVKRYRKFNANDDASILNFGKIMKNNFQN